MRALPVLVFLQLLGGIAASAAQVTPAYEPNFSLTISTPDQVVKSGAEVKLKVAFANNTAQPLHYATGAPGRNGGPGFDIDIHDSQGKRISETPYGLKIQGKARHRPFAGSVFAATVQPGDTVELEVLLSREYDISEPGKYTVQATEKGPNPQQGKSNIVTITVTP